MENNDMQKEMKINPEQEAELRKLYQESKDKFADAWIEGVYERLDRENPQFAAKIDASRDTLDEVWKKVRGGTASREGFISALNEWQALHIKVLQKLGRI